MSTMTSCQHSAPTGIMGTCSDFWRFFRNRMHVSHSSAHRFTSLYIDAHQTIRAMSSYVWSPRRWPPKMPIWHCKKHHHFQVALVPTSPSGTTGTQAGPPFVETDFSSTPSIANWNPAWTAPSEAFKAPFGGAFNRGCSVAARFASAL